MAIEGDLFREIMSTFPSGVAIVTARGDDGKPRGLTVSAFCPVSLSPPLVLVCIDKASNSLIAIQRSGGFTVNLLAAGREELARRYADRIIAFRAGEVVYDGPPDDLTPEIVEEVYRTDAAALEKL
jgi:flavin reductase ActVB